VGVLEQMFADHGLIEPPEYRLRASASQLWSQRHNPPSLPVSTFVAAFHRLETDSSIWHSEDGRWAAELRRARRGQHLYLAIWRDGTLLGTYDGRRGWQAAGGTTLRRKRAIAHQLALGS
jgi:hypothetical protein